MSYYTIERITQVHHWNDTLFSFRCSRSPALQFDNGQFVLIGLMVDGKPLMRAYSFVNKSTDAELEFLSIKVPEGALTSRLCQIRIGDELLVAKVAKGSLVTDDLLPGKRLFMLATGTGLAPFMSILRDGAVFQRFDHVVLVHGVRRVSELAYRAELDQLAAAPIFDYYPTVTREAFVHQQRIPALISTGQLFSDLQIAPLNPQHDRAMICGNKPMLMEITSLLGDLGFVQSMRRGTPGHFLIEQAFAGMKSA